MPATKKNTYEIGVNNDISNVANNVDYNRLGTDQVIIEISGPNLLIKNGSLIEANGSLWAVDSGDLSIPLADGYLVFDDSTGDFSIINSEVAVLDPERAGFYRPSPNDTQRVARWDISGTDLILNITRQLYTESTNKTKLEGALETGGKITSQDEIEASSNIISGGSVDVANTLNIADGTINHDDIRGTYSSDSNTSSSYTIPKGLWMVYISGRTSSSDVQIELRDSGDNWRVLGRIFGFTRESVLVLSDGSNARVNRVASTYDRASFKIGG